MATDDPPLVSIIIPMYNEEEFIQTTINSLLDQTYTNFELILVDDNSTDDTVTKARTLVNDDRHTVIKNKTNMGQTFSRNRGTMYANGTYIVFHDADDVSMPDRLKKQVEFLENNPEVGVVGGAFYYVNPAHEEPELRVRPSSDGDIRRGMGRGSMINAGTAMYRRNALFDAGLFQSENVEGYELIIEIGRSWKLANLSNPIYIYRINSGSRSQKNEIVKKTVLAYRSWQAIKAFDLPYWNLLLQFGWLFYMNLPPQAQRLIRTAVLPAEQRGITEGERQEIRELLSSHD